MGGSYASDAGPEQSSGAAGPVYQEGDQQNQNKNSLLVGEHLLVAEGHQLEGKACHCKGEEAGRIKMEELGASKDRTEHEPLKNDQHLIIFFSI